MDNVIRLSKFVKNLGIVTTVLFLIIVLVTFVTGNMGVAICFMPFVFLGIALILAYKKQIIVVNEDEIVFSYLVKKTQHIKYNDIRCILMIPLNGRTDVILIDKMYNRSHHKKRTRTGVSITIYGCSNSNAFIPEYE